MARQSRTSPARRCARYRGLRKGARRMESAGAATSCALTGDVSTSPRAAFQPARPPSSTATLRQGRGAGQRGGAQEASLARSCAALQSARRGCRGAPAQRLPHLLCPSTCHVHQARGAVRSPPWSYTTTTLAGVTRSASAAASKAAVPGSMLCNPVLVSAMRSRSKKRAPGIRSRWKSAAPWPAARKG